MSDYDQGRGQVIGDIDKIIRLLKDVCQMYGTEEKNLPSHLREIIEGNRTYVIHFRYPHCLLIVLK